MRSERIQLRAAPGAMVAVDLNGDGKTDLIVAHPDDGSVAVLLGDGEGGFAPAPGSPFAAGKNPNDIAVADINGDGKLDLAIANHEATFVSILLGDGRGAFAPSPQSPVRVKTFPHTHTVALGDVNGDKKVDLIVDDWGKGNVTLLLGDGAGGFGSPGTSIPVPPVPYENIRLADINGDGRLDIVAPARMGLAGATVGEREGITVLLGDGHGGFKPAAGSPFAAGKSPFWVEVGDLNGDGKADLVVATYSGHATDSSSDGVAVLLGDGKGAFQPAPGSPFKSGKAPTRVAVGDVNGDGIDDAVILNLSSNDATVVIGGRNGIALAPSSPFKVGSKPVGAAIADINSDGRGEILVANHDSRDLTILFSK